MTRKRTEPGTGMQLHGHNPGLARWLVLLCGLAAALVLVVATTRDAGADTEQITIVPVAGGQDDLLDIASSSFSDVEAALGGGTMFTIPVAVPGLQALPQMSVESTIDAGNRVIALQSASGAWFGPSSAPDGLPTEVMLVAQWENDLDTAPDIALAGRLVSVEPGELVPMWTGIAGVTDTFELDDAVVLLNPGGPFTLDPGTLPGPVRDFLGVAGQLDEAVLVDEREPMEQLRG